MGGGFKKGLIMIVKKLGYLLVGSVIKGILQELAKLFENSSFKIFFELFSKTVAKTIAKLSSEGLTNFLVHFLIYKAYKAMNKMISDLIFEGFLKSVIELVVGKFFKRLPIFSK